ncbi:helicase [Bdellovibrio sp. HCB290]|uniref:helicase n=1 Tax=Bdellovibrio sp. HCB290 TaxID=3394356 RepID=UPI0039B54171
MKLTGLACIIFLLTSCQSFRDYFYREGILPFTSDGCSMSPNGPRDNPYAFLECCVQHDYAYWQGGTLAQKEQADLSFNACITEHSNETVGNIYYRAVSLGGGPQFNTPFRWGYGWNRHRGYKQLTSQELYSVEAKSKQIQWDLIYSSLRGK